MPIRRSDHGCHGYSSSRNLVLWGFSSLVVQYDQAPRITRLQTTSTGGARARARRVAGCATSTSSAGHAGAQANLKLTFRLDHPVGADQSICKDRTTLRATRSAGTGLLEKKCRSRTRGLLPVQEAFSSVVSSCHDGTQLAPMMKPL